MRLLHVCLCVGMCLFSATGAEAARSRPAAQPAARATVPARGGSNLSGSWVVLMKIPDVYGSGLVPSGLFFGMVDSGGYLAFSISGDQPNGDGLHVGSLVTFGFNNFTGGRDPVFTGIAKGDVMFGTVTSSQWNGRSGVWIAFRAP